MNCKQVDLVISDLSNITWEENIATHFPDNDITCFALDFSVVHWDIDNAMMLLSTEEKERSLKFFQKIDQQRYAYAHALLRLMAHKYTGILPNQLQFRLGVNHKPYLTTDGLFFNISHAGNMVMICFGNKEVGIDVENIKPLQIEFITSRYFSECEQQIIKNASNPLFDFYRLWTRKEAFLKANGMGISTELQTIEVCSEKQRLELEKAFPEINYFDKYYIYSGSIEDQYCFSIASSQHSQIKFYSITSQFINEAFSKKIIAYG